MARLTALREKAGSSLIWRFLACRFGGVLAERTFLVSLGTLLAFVVFAVVGLAFEDIVVYVLDGLGRVLGLMFG